MCGGFNAGAEPSGHPLESGVAGDPPASATGSAGASLVPPEKKKAVLEKKVKSASSVKVARKVKKTVDAVAAVGENGDNDAAEA